MLVNLCYISRAMAVIKVPNSESDLQGHSRALTVVPFDRPHTISYYSSTATMSLSCTVSEILSLFPLNLKRSRDSEHIPFECLHACACVCVNTSLPPCRCLSWLKCRSINLPNRLLLLFITVRAFPNASSNGFTYTTERFTNIKSAHAAQWLSEQQRPKLLQRCTKAVDLYDAKLWNSSLKWSGRHMLKKSHSFTCHTHVYARMEWAILPLIPCHTASLHFGRYSFSVPQRVGGWVGLGSWLHTKVVCPPQDGHPSQYRPTNNAVARDQTHDHLNCKSDALTTRILNHHKTVPHGSSSPSEGWAVWMVKVSESIRARCWPETHFLFLN